MIYLDLNMKSQKIFQFSASSLLRILQPLTYSAISSRIDFFISLNCACCCWFCCLITRISSLSGINSKHSFKILTVKVKPVSKPASFNQCPFRCIAGGGAALLPFGAQPTVQCRSVFGGGYLYECLIQNASYPDRTCRAS